MAHLSADLSPAMAGDVWSLILALIETKVDHHSFYTWFKPTSFLKDEGQTIIVKVPNDLFRDWLIKHYAGVIGEAVDLVVSIQRAGKSRRVRDVMRVTGFNGSHYQTLHSAQIDEDSHAA